MTSFDLRLKACLKTVYSKMLFLKRRIQFKPLIHFAKIKELKKKTNPMTH